MCTYFNTQAYIHIYNDLGACAGAPLRLIVVVCEAPATLGTPEYLKGAPRSAPLPFALVCLFVVAISSICSVRPLNAPFI